MNDDPLQVALLALVGFGVLLGILAAIKKFVADATAVERSKLAAEISALRTRVDLQQTQIDKMESKFTEHRKEIYSFVRNEIKDSSDVLKTEIEGVKTAVGRMDAKLDDFMLKMASGRAFYLGVQTGEDGK